MDGIQTLLVVVIVTLTLLIVIVGVQVFLIVVGVRRILGKIEKKIDESDVFTKESANEVVSDIKDFFRKKILGKG